MVELSALTHCATCADRTVSSVRRVFGPGLTSQGMLQAQVPALPDKFHDNLISQGSVLLMKAGEELSARRDTLVDALGAAMEAGLPETYAEELEEIVLGECFDAF